MRVQTPSEGLAPRVQTVKDLLKTLGTALQPAPEREIAAAAGEKSQRTLG